MGGVLHCPQVPPLQSFSGLPIEFRVQLFWIVDTKVDQSKEKLTLTQRRMRKDPFNFAENLRNRNWENIAGIQEAASSYIL